MNTSCIFKGILISGLGAALLSSMCGCVAGQAIALRHDPGTFSTMSDPAKTVSVESKDSREFVASGNKNPAYLGHFRAGFGNTWDVHNAHRKAIAEQFREDLLAELKARGFKTVESGQRQLVVEIKDWNFDAYQNGRIWYEIAVSVIDAQGTVLGKKLFKDEKVIRGSVWVGPAAAFKREVPVIYSGIIDSIFADAAIKNALK